ncbi:MAG: DUF2924 domain-containing protein [Proteobacteria bacterium]|nr:DUF2924 domain-containing protein [Pseudomonadota bacterium]
MNRKGRSSVKSPVTADLAALSGLDREDLVARWQALYGVPPPRKISRQLLLQAVAYRLQEQASEGLKPATRRYLEQVASGDKRQKTAVLVSAKPGTRLLREWRGVTYEATVLDDGVLFQGRKYRSLSEVARAITGARWSGPLFFGLKRKSGEKEKNL